jgi:hypothetical protein
LSDFFGSLSIFIFSSTEFSVWRAVWNSFVGLNTALALRAGEQGLEFTDDQITRNAGTIDILLMEEFESERSFLEWFLSMTANWSLRLFPMGIHGSFVFPPCYLNSPLSFGDPMDFW